MRRPLPISGWRVSTGSSPHNRAFYIIGLTGRWRFPEKAIGTACGDVRFVQQRGHGRSPITRFMVASSHPGFARLYSSSLSSHSWFFP